MEGSKFNQQTCLVAWLADVDDSGTLDIVMRTRSTLHLEVYTSTSKNLKPLGSKTKLPNRPFQDMAFADFNNDLLVDIMGVLPCIDSMSPIQVTDWTRFTNVSKTHLDTGWYEIRLTSRYTEYLPWIFVKSSGPILFVSTSIERMNTRLINKHVFFLKTGSILKHIEINSPFEICGNTILAADFDNDMDVDAFILRDSLFCQRKSLFLTNDGKGSFYVVEADDLDCQNLYRPESAAAVDFNLDGFMDISVSAGAGLDPFRLGRYGLWKNSGGNLNNWIEIRLIGGGERVNRDAIGAIVIAKTPDGKRQYRAQNGGMHGRSQDSQIIHFGLGQNVKVDICVHWPDQTKTEARSLKCNQFIDIRALT